MATYTYRGDSYAGIVDAITELQAKNLLPQKTYASNYEGIIEALKDIGKLGDASVGELPPGWNVEIDEDGNIIDSGWTETPRNGQLWFDTRQGRLFMWLDGAFYQCNGADGLTVVGETQPDREVIGALWYNTLASSLYIYDGNTWAIVGGSSAYSTETMPLSNGTTDAFGPTDGIVSNPQQLVSQSDYNTWSYQAIDALEDAVKAIVIPHVPNALVAGSNAPASPDQNDLWYHTTEGQLKIYRTGEWYSTSEVNDEQLEALETTVNNNNQARVNDIATINSTISSLQNLPHHTYDVATNNDGRVNRPTAGIYVVDDDSNFSGIDVEGKHGTYISTTGDKIIIDTGDLLNDINAIEDDYLTSTDYNLLTSVTDSLQNQINALDNDKISTSIFSDLQTLVNSRPTLADLGGLLDRNGGTMEGDINLGGYKATNMAQPTAPGDAARKQDVDNLRQYANDTFFRKAGGVLRNVSIQNADINNAAFDFSSTATDGRNAFKFKANGGTAYSSFGTTDSPWEYAWTFGQNEDFAYVHTTEGKSVSINKDGLATKQLLISEFQPNTVGGRVLTNPVNVGQKLATHDAQIHALNVSMAGVNTYIYYTDTEPTEGVENGNLWFDSTNLKLYVRHQGAWVNPDRVEVDNTCQYQIYYQDAAPASAHDGDFWFDTCELKLYVKHGGAWINPDRTETESTSSNELTTLQAQVESLTTTISTLGGNDLNLKSNLFNAVASSTSFVDLKARLMAALSS